MYEAFESVEDHDDEFSEVELEPSDELELPLLLPLSLLLGYCLLVVDAIFLVLSLKGRFRFDLVEIFSLAFPDFFGYLGNLKASDVLLLENFDDLDEPLCDEENSAAIFLRFF